MMKDLEILVCHGKVCLHQEGLWYCAESYWWSIPGALRYKAQVLQVHPHPVNILNKAGSNYLNSTVENKLSNPS